MKFGSVIDAGSMGPLPVRVASNCRNGVMKSASTPSMSSPSIMFVVQFKRIISRRQLQGLVLARRFNFMIADSAMELHAARLMVYECAWRADRGEDVRNLSYMV